MTPITVDASVAVKWVLPAVNEPLREEATELLARHVAGTQPAIVPDLFWPEVLQVLWKAARQGRIKPAAARTGLDTLRQLGLRTCGSEAVLGEALEMALSFEHSAYDCIYVALAQSRGSALVTADERLARALGSRFPVRWLGASF